MSRKYPVAVFLAAICLAPPVPVAQDFHLRARLRRTTVALAEVVSPAKRVFAQVSGTVAPALTPAQITASESLAPKFDESAAKEHARLKTFATRPLGGVIQRSFNIFTNYLTMAAEMMPESGYGFRPTPDVRTFGEQINHATATHYSFCNQTGLPAGVEKQQAPDLRAIKVKAEIVKALRESIAYCDRILAAASEEWLIEVIPAVGGPSSGQIRGMRAHIFIYNAVHSAEDYGTITTYLRMQGVVPPSTALHPAAPARGAKD